MPAASPDLSHECILIVDDEKDNLEVAQNTLELLYNARVVAVSSGLAALDTLSEAITVILCDLMMPGMTGFELLPKLRERTRVPIIALTAAAMQHDKEEALAAGFDGFIPKPFEADRMAADISTCIAHIRAKRRQPQAGSDGVASILGGEPRADAIGAISPGPVQVLVSGTVSGGAAIFDVCPDQQAIGLGAVNEHSEKPVGERTTITGGAPPVVEGMLPASAAAVLPAAVMPVQPSVARPQPNQPAV